MVKKKTAVEEGDESDGKVGNDGGRGSGRR